MAFIGEHNSKLDDKGRLVFPSDFRAQALADGVGNSFVVRKNIFGPSLEMYTMDAWKKYSDEMEAKLRNLSRAGNERWEAFNSNRTLVTPDEKTGRIIIPKYLLEKIHVEKDVVFFGMNDKIQVWAKETWDARLVDDDELVDYLEGLEKE